MRAVDAICAGGCWEARVGLAAAVDLSIEGIGGPLQVLIRLGRARRRCPVAGATGHLSPDEARMNAAAPWLWGGADSTGLGPQPLRVLRVSTLAAKVWPCVTRCAECCASACPAASRRLARVDHAVQQRYPGVTLVITRAAPAACSPVVPRILIEHFSRSWSGAEHQSSAGF